MLRTNLHAIICVVVLVPAVSCQITAPPLYDGQKGDKGEPGSPGASGEQGATGAKGVPGMVGATGFKGNQGEQGIAGQNADFARAGGATGVMGSTGSTGATGDQGEKGMKGAPGMVGATGAPGQTGWTGFAGEKGDKGDRGVKGLAGEPGDNGVKGFKGHPGASGDPGLPGQTGSTGKIGFPFQYDQDKYSYGCLELQGYGGMDCRNAHYCQDVVNISTGIVSGQCRCLDGYTMINNRCTSRVVQPEVRDCSINNGGCQHTCSNSRCYCEKGYMLRAKGTCVDVDECTSRTHQCHASTKCLNTLGSYRCLLDPSQLTTERNIVGKGLVDGHILLSLLIWVLLMLIIVLALLIVFCCLPSVKAAEPAPPTMRTVEYLTPRQTPNILHN